MRAMRRFYGLVVLFLLAFTIACLNSRPALQFSPDQLPEGRAGQPYTATIAVSGNVTPVDNISVPERELPRGLVLKFNEQYATADISGVPQAAGTYRIKVSAWCLGTNVSGQTGNREYQLIVR